tara:strand:- start:1033 stop:2637 length:1605 start_codon:yes stop_codon:yes gene_type:complete
MSDDKDYTSLLGRSSGSSWGDIAGAYLSGGKKKDNRARNVLLASLFFNAKEANMQSKVLKNIKELENQKTIEQARLTKQWEKREKLQTEYEGVKEKGAYNYYKTDAETAFEEEHGTDPKYSLKAYQPEKINWMKKWTSKKETDLNARYSGVDTNILTKEEFMEPINAYYRAKQKDYLNPQNRSLVHKALGKIGFGTNRSEETGNFLNKEGEDSVALFKERKEEHQERINNLTSQEKAEIKIINNENDDSVKLTNADFNTLLQESGMFEGTSEKTLRGKRLAYADFASGNKSYNSALEIIGSSIISFDVNQTQSTINDVKSRYIALEGPMNFNMTSIEKNRWERGFKTQLAVAFGMTESISTQRENRANELFELGLNKGLYKSDDENRILKDIIGQDLLAATGEVDYNQIKSDIIREKTLENLLILQESPAESQRAAMAQARIKQINFIEPDDKKYLKSQLSVQAYQSLIDVNFDMIEWNKTKLTAKDDKGSSIINDVDKSIIRELQTSLWLQDGTSKAFIAGDAIVAQLKKLNL